jgi:hypothetical protein
VSTRSFHSSTYQLNLSRLCHCNLKINRAYSTESAHVNSKRVRAGVPGEQEEILPGPTAAVGAGAEDAEGCQVASVVTVTAAATGPTVDGGLLIAGEGGAARERRGALLLPGPGN